MVATAVLGSIMTPGSALASGDPPECSDSSGQFEIGEAGLAGSCFDNEEDDLTITITDAPDPAKGTAEVMDQGTPYAYVQYTASAEGSDSFKFKANDGSSDSNEVTVTTDNVPATNDSPECFDDSLSFQVGEPADYAGSCYDEENGNLTITITKQGTKGTASVVDQGTEFPYVQYKATANGTDTIQFKASDGNTSSNVATITTSNSGGKPPPPPAHPAQGTGSGTGTPSHVINGTAGNDTINGTPGDDVINAGAGNDVVDGGGGNDIINGQGGKDKLSGGAGKDKVSGGNGDDKLSGGTGNDKLSGGKGKDKLSGGAGKDKLSGNGGNDRASGGSGKDSVSGNAGKDKLVGGGSNDRVLGGSGDDKLSGNGGKDHLSGGSGNDKLSGGSGNDRLSGGKGNDRLSGGAGQDRLKGGSGHNRLIQ